MRFFFEFVSCCSSPASERKVLAEDEERSLVLAPVAAASSRRLCRKKQRKIGASEWKPSLGSISEDNVPPRDRNGSRNCAVAKAGRDAEKRSAAGDAGAAKARQRSYSDGYDGTASMPTVMPAFSPTPFMF